MRDLRLVTGPCPASPSPWKTVRNCKHDNRRPPTLNLKIYGLGQFRGLLTGDFLPLQKEKQSRPEYVQCSGGLVFGVYLRFRIPARV